MTPATPTTTWNIDPAHSAAEFKVKHMMICNVKGSFSGLSGVLSLDEADVTKSRVEASIPVSHPHHRGRPARWPPQERRFLRCREVSHLDLQIH